MSVDTSIDIFNGDADGIFALLQWRKCHPAAQQTLITGVKRDHALVERLAEIAAPTNHKSTELAVFDIPFDKNRTALAAALRDGYQAVYFDHHYCKPPFQHASLTTHIETSADICTGLLVDKVLNGRQRLWALAAAYGDNLEQHADRLAIRDNLNEQQRQQLQRLGWLVNYNSYGAQVSDLHMSPASLYLQLTQYDDPFAVIADRESAYHRLDSGFAADLALAETQTERKVEANLVSVFLGGASWARRISGSFANRLSQQYPTKAIVVATENLDQTTWTVSLRSPQAHRDGANLLCGQFGGGGRAGAGGINTLAPADYPALLARVSDYYKPLLMT